MVYSRCLFGVADYPRIMFRENYYWQNKYAASCLLKYGVTISQLTKDFSWLLCRVNELEFAYRQRLIQLVNSEVFKD
ncbi:MAG: hypothetical protein F6K24_26030 [Okeania sp. SIO2D1]|nr:hypothetical protein [Okeania sp. SIO2D1]